MQNYESDGYSLGCVIDLDSPSSHEDQIELNDYLLQSAQKLDAITEIVNRREAVDHDSHDWMLAQVDFIVETVGNEGLELGGELRSNLLQFLLAVANLNEQMRQQSSLSQ